MRGKLTVITGCMFSGKTTKIISLAQQAMKRKSRYPGLSRIDSGEVVTSQNDVAIFYPEIDTRYTKNYITSHDMVQLPSTPLPIDTAHIQHRVLDTVFIDEIHFFKPNIIDAIKKLLAAGVDVIVSGLDKDFRGEGFGIVPQLMEMADTVIPLEVKCVVCQKPATFSQRIIDDDKTIVIGGEDMYEPRCIDHFIKPQ